MINLKIDNCNGVYVLCDGVRRLEGIDEIVARVEGFDGARGEIVVRVVFVCVFVSCGVCFEFFFCYV